jgi:hypothetical protein
MIWFATRAKGARELTALRTSEGNEMPNGPVHIFRIIDLFQEQVL